MYTVTDNDETHTFETIAELKAYLAETCATEYALDVLEWALGPMVPSKFEIGNGKLTDTWQKGWGGHDGT
jgi:hypothetical protein